MGLTSQSSDSLRSIRISILATGGPWEQQEGHMGFQRRTFRDFEPILGPSGKSLLVLLSFSKGVLACWCLGASSEIILRVSEAENG